MTIGPLKIHSCGRRKAKRRHQPPAFLPPLVPCNVPANRCPVPRDQASHRILIMRVGAFGDILMGTPLLAALRRAYPNAHLTWIAEYTEIEAIDANPYIDELVRWDGSYWKRMVRKLAYVSWLRHVMQMRKTLHRKQYDVFVSFQPEEWPLLAYGVGAKLKVGVFDTFRRYYRAQKTSGNTRLYTNSYSYLNLPDHRIDQYLLTLEALGLPPAPTQPLSIGYTEADREAAKLYLSNNGFSGQQPLVLLAPLTTWPTKCWSPECYAELANALAREQNCRMIVIGSGKEREAVEALAAQMEPRPLTAAGTLTFRQMAALADQCALVVSGDTGPMHVASALNIPQVALFGPTSPKWYGPRSPHAISLLHPVPCGPCDQKFCPNEGETHLICMRLLTVPEVLKAISDLWAAAGVVSSAEGL